MLSFHFVDKRELFAMKLSFEEFNLVFCRFFAADLPCEQRPFDERLACFEPTEAASRGTQRPNVSKYDRTVSNGFLCALEACLVNLELP